MAEYADSGGAIKARRNDYIKLIDAVKARHGCNRKCFECDFAEVGDSWCNGEVFVVDLLRVPAADVVPVRHGRWIDMGDFISCSSCNATRLKEFESDYGKVMRIDVRTNYCPNCGARMDGDGE